MKNKIIDVICFVGGSSIFTGTLFSVKSYGRDFFGGYYFSNTQIGLLCTGIGLIVLGFLIRSWKNQ